MSSEPLRLLRFRQGKCWLSANRLKSWLKAELMRSLLIQRLNCNNSWINLKKFWMMERSKDRNRFNNLKLRCKTWSNCSGRSTKRTISQSNSSGKALTTRSRSKCKKIAVSWIYWLMKDSNNLMALPKNKIHQLKAPWAKLTETMRCDQWRIKLTWSTSIP